MTNKKVFQGINVKKSSVMQVLPKALQPLGAQTQDKMDKMSTLRRHYLFSMLFTPEIQTKQKLYDGITSSVLGWCALVDRFSMKRSIRRKLIKKKKGMRFAETNVIHALLEFPNGMLWTMQDVKLLFLLIKILFLLGWCRFEIDSWKGAKRPVDVSF